MSSRYAECLLFIALLGVVAGLLSALIRDMT